MKSERELVNPERLNQVVGHLGKAVALETTAGRSNGEYIDAMRGRFDGFMAEHHVPPELFDVVQTESLGPGGSVQYSLAVRIGPKTDGGIAFVGHSDVVAVSEDDRTRWSTPPFQMITERNPDGSLRYRGRGTSDMLGGNEAAFSALEEAAKDVGSLKKPLYFALSWGEELTCMGGDDIVDALERIGARPDVVIVPEPTGDSILTAHKGAQVIDYRINGQGAFRSAVQLVKGIHEIQDTLRQDPLLQDPAFDPPYAVANVGMVRLDPVTHEVSVGVQVRDTPEKAPLETIKEQLDELTCNILNTQPPGTSGEQTGDGTLQRIIFTGIGGHSAFPERGVDTGRAMVASMQALGEIQEIYPGVTVDVVGAVIGNASNAIPGSGELQLALAGQDVDGAWEEMQGRLAAISTKMQTDAESALSHGGNGNISEIGIETEQTEAKEQPLPNAAKQEAQLTIDVALGGRAYPLPPQDPGRVAVLGQIIADATGEMPNTQTVAYGTDAGYIEKWIRPLVPHALVVVNGLGDMLQGPHGLNEYADERQIVGSILVYDRLTDELKKPENEYALGAGH